MLQRTQFVISEQFIELTQPFDASNSYIVTHLVQIVALVQSSQFSAHGSHFVEEFTKWPLKHDVHWTAEVTQVLQLGSHGLA
jgi:hypothetical protein